MSQTVGIEFYMRAILMKLLGGGDKEEEVKKLMFIWNNKRDELGIRKITSALQW